jgi:hypothetical protein
MLSISLECTRNQLRGLSPARRKDRNYSFRNMIATRLSRFPNTRAQSGVSYDINNASPRATKFHCRLFYCWLWVISCQIGKKSGRLGVVHDVRTSRGEIARLPKISGATRRPKKASTPSRISDFSGSAGSRRRWRRRRLLVLALQR